MNRNQTKQTHFVEFFDSFTMANRRELCRVLTMSFASNMAMVEVTRPIVKRVRVPINCLVCRFTGFRLGENCNGN